MSEEPKATRMRFMDSWPLRVGLILFLVGCGPLFLIILAAKLGITNDPNPNPIGPGILAGLSIWPSFALILVGIVQVLWSKGKVGD